MPDDVVYPQEAVDRLCRRFHIRLLVYFPDRVLDGHDPCASNVTMIFAAGKTPRLTLPIAAAQIQRRLSQILGRRVIVGLPFANFRHTDPLFAGGAMVIYQHPDFEYPSP